jgi:hypothetical protein
VAQVDNAEPVAVGVGQHHEAPGPAILLATPTVKVISTGIATWQIALIAIGAGEGYDSGPSASYTGAARAGA